MKRSVLLSIIAALALAVGFSSVATAGVDGGAQASAKKGKGKSCKGKKGKGKAGKGKKSAAASAKKGKGKAKGCKAKGKGKGNADPVAPQPPAPPAPAPPTPQASWPLSDGIYEDAGSNAVVLTISGGGSQAKVDFSGASTCFPFFVGSEPAPVTATATSLQAKGVIGNGGAINGKWDITVTPDLGYQLITDSSFEFPDQDPCSKTGVVFNGTLSKTS